jgi:hypothetical protein
MNNTNPQPNIAQKAIALAAASKKTFAQAAVVTFLAWDAFHKQTPEVVLVTAPAAVPVTAPVAAPVAVPTTVPVTSPAVAPARVPVTEFASVTSSSQKNEVPFDVRVSTASFYGDAYPHSCRLTNGNSISISVTEGGTTMDITENRKTTSYLVRDDSVAVPAAPGRPLDTKVASGVLATAKFAAGACAGARADQGAFLNPRP